MLSQHVIDVVLIVLLTILDLNGPYAKLFSGQAVTVVVSECHLSKLEFSVP